MKRMICLFLVYFSVMIFAQNDGNKLDFSLLRQYDEIEISKPKNFYHNIKQIKISENSNLSFGGSYRFQAENFMNEIFMENVAPTNYWFLHRGLFHGDLRLSSKFQLFGELASSLIFHKEHTSPVDEDKLYLNQFFIKYNLNNYWQLLIGRQNMKLGSGRLVDPREGPNVRLSFDMAQVQYTNNKSKILGFYAIPVQQKPGIFDNNSFDSKEIFSALYWTQKWKENSNSDVYLLYKIEKDKEWDVSTADDKRLSMGVRLFGEWNSITYDNEVVYQIGKLGEKDIRAWTASFHLAKDFHIPKTFTLGLKAEAISGDENKNDDIVNTFDGLYPRGAYFGRVAYFGPSNLIDIHPYVKSNIGKFNLELDFDVFWRYSIEDGIYNPALILTYPSNNNEKFLANQVGVIGSYPLNNFINLELESNIIFPGEFLKQLGHNKTLYHIVFTTDIKF